MKTLIKIYKDSTDYGITIPKDTLGKDIEIGLANAIKLIADHQREHDPDFKTETLIESIKMWVKCLS